MATRTTVRADEVQVGDIIWDEQLYFVTEVKLLSVTAAITAKRIGSGATNQWALPRSYSVPITRPNEDVGVLGIPTTVIGSVVQELGRAAIERGNVTDEQVVEYLTSDDFNESVVWDTLGQIIDQIEGNAQNAAERSKPGQQYGRRHDDERELGS